MKMNLNDRPFWMQCVILSLALPFFILYLLITIPFELALAVIFKKL
jgi:hypothetical protein